MTWYSSRRAAACGGALAITIAMGAIVAPAAQADVLDLGGTAGAVTSTVASVGATAAGTVGAVTGAAGGTAQTPVAVSDPAVPQAVATTATTATTTVQSATGAASSATSTASTGSTAAGTAVDSSSGTTAGSAVGGAVSGVLDQVGDLLGGAVTTSGGGGLNGGAVEVVVGSNGAGGSLADVSLGGTAQGLPSVSAPAVRDGVDGAAGTASTPASGTGTAGTGSAASGAARLLGLGVGRSVSTVYPVKDGYRDDVVFTLDGVTPSGGAEALDGTAVLRRGKTIVKRWAVSRSDQQLRWDGRSGSKIVTGAYTLTTGATDAAGHAYTATTGVTVSAKRLVASTAKVSALATSGRHRMIAAPRAGLGRGDVTVRVTTVASRVRGGVQKLIFEKNGKQLVVPIRKGTHTSKAITVPKAFTDFTIKHTWKKGQVVLKAVRYTYSYQSLK